MITTRIILNLRPGIDWNTCGQAAVATVLAHFHLGPFAPGSAPITDAEAIDRLLETFRPDLPFGLGTSAWRLAAALRRHGLRTERVHSGWLGRRGGDALQRLRAHLDRGLPAIVCLDDGALGGRPWGAHWAVALGIERGAVRLGNAGTPSVPLDRFMTAWRCRHLPLHHHCALLAAPETGS